MNRRYELRFRPAAAKVLRRLPHEAAKRIKTAVEDLQNDPRPHGVTTLQGQPGLLRIRVGDYRVVYSVDDGRLPVRVLHLGHRREVYRGL